MLRKHFTPSLIIKDSLLPSMNTTYSHTVRFIKEGNCLHMLFLSIFDNELEIWIVGVYR